MKTECCHFRLQTNSVTYPSQDAISYVVGAPRSLLKHALDVAWIIYNVLMSVSHRLEVFPEFSKKLFLEIAVTSAAASNASAIAAASSLVAKSE